MPYRELPHMKPTPLQAIVTKYLGPTNVRGSRIKATAAARSLTVHRDDSLGIEENHARAAQQLAELLEWRGKWVMGGTPDGRGYVFACLDGTFGAAFTTSGKKLAA
jgi:hypothetical protein